MTLVMFGGSDVSFRIQGIAVIAQWFLDHLLLKLRVEVGRG